MQLSQEIILTQLNRKERQRGRGRERQREGGREINGDHSHMIEKKGSSIELFVLYSVTHSLTKQAISLIYQYLRSHGQFVSVLYLSCNVNAEKRPCLINFLLSATTTAVGRIFYKHLRILIIILYVQEVVTHFIQ